MPILNESINASNKAQARSSVLIPLWRKQHVNDPTTEYIEKNQKDRTCKIS